MSDAPQDQIAPLLTEEGWELLASLGPYREDRSFTLSSSLRKAGHSPELVSAVLTQSRLRTKAEAKFGEFARQIRDLYLGARVGGIVVLIVSAVIAAAAAVVLVRDQRNAGDEDADGGEDLGFDDLAGR